MKLTPVLAIVGVCLQFLPVAGLSIPALAEPQNVRDPYAVCHNQQFDPDEFNRCISDVYMHENRKAETTAGFQQAVGGVGGSERGSAQQCLQRNPCVFNPSTGRYQECLHVTNAEECIQYGGPCQPAGAQGVR